MTGVRHQHGTVRQRLDMALHRELQSGERVRWQGMKLARIDLASFGIYLFAIPWTAFAVFWMVMASAGVSASSDVGLIGWAFPAFGIPFVLIGLGMMATPFVPLTQRGRILFAVTSTRILKLSLGRELKVESTPADRLGEIVRHERADGSGTVKITLGNSSGLRRSRMQKLVVGQVDDVKAAHEAILELEQGD